MEDVVKWWCSSVKSRILQDRCCMQRVSVSEGKNGVLLSYGYIEIIRCMELGYRQSASRGCKYVDL